MVPIYSSYIDAYYKGEKFDKAVFSISQKTYESLKEFMLKNTKLEQPFLLPIQEFQYEGKTYYQLKTNKKVPAGIPMNEALTLNADYFTWDYMEKKGVRVNVKSFERVVTKNPTKKF